MDITSLIIETVSGAVGGAILMIIVGIIKNKMAQK
jgi:hypothetical protein